jgi:hypothetical protein
MKRQKVACGTEQTTNQTVKKVKKVVAASRVLV